MGLLAGVSGRVALGSQQDNLQGTVSHTHRLQGSGSVQGKHVARGVDKEPGPPKHPELDRRVPRGCLGLNHRVGSCEGPWGAPSTPDPWAPDSGSEGRAARKPGICPLGVWSCHACSP